MEIIRPITQNKVDIDVVENGEIFRVDNSYYIKITEGDFQETEGPRAYGPVLTINAINLETGDWAYFSSMTRVAKVKGAFIVEG